MRGWEQGDGAKSLAKTSPAHARRPSPRVPLPANLQRKAGCACGGSCPRCASSATSNDVLEREADRTADQVMRMPSASPASPAAPSLRARSGRAQRKANTPRPLASPPHTKAPGLGNGRPLGRAERNFFEPRFGRDFSRVRIHDGETAARSASAAGARAYASGTDLVFGAGEYRPDRSEGKRLLAHELTHVVQQSEGRAPAGKMQRQASPSGSPPASFEEFVICLAICICDTAPLLSSIGRQLRQVCVSQLLSELDQRAGHLTTIKAEQSYDMTRTPPHPIMSPAHPLRPGSRWTVLRYIRSQIPNFIPATGMVRRPDVVITQNPLLPPEQANIRRVVEIKFPGDVLTAAQQRAYETIAGSPSRFTVLTPGPTSCNCDLMRQHALQAFLIAMEIILILAAMAFILGNDATGIGVADDPLLIPLGARLTMLAARLSTMLPRATPLLVPVLQHAR